MLEAYQHNIVNSWNIARWWFCLTINVYLWCWVMPPRLLWVIVTLIIFIDPNWIVFFPFKSALYLNFHHALWCFNFTYSCWIIITLIFTNEWLARTQGPFCISGSLYKASMSELKRYLFRTPPSVNKKKQVVRLPRLRELRIWKTRIWTPHLVLMNLGLGQA